MDTTLRGRRSLEPYDKRANAYKVRFDTPPLKNANKWVGLRNYRVSRRKTWRNLDIDDPFVGRKYQGRLDDFSNPFKDITKPVFQYARQMRDGRRYNYNRTDKWPVPNERERYGTDPGNGNSWTFDQSATGRKSGLYQDDPPTDYWNNGGWMDADG